MDRGKTLKRMTSNFQTWDFSISLVFEETKAKALQEELENPMNVHRWRELEVGIWPW